MTQSSKKKKTASGSNAGPIFITRASTMKPSDIQFADESRQFVPQRALTEVVQKLSADAQAGTDCNVESGSFPA